MRSPLFSALVDNSDLEKDSFREEKRREESHLDSEGLTKELVIVALESVAIFTNDLDRSFIFEFMSVMSFSQRFWRP